MEVQVLSSAPHSFPITRVLRAIEHSIRDEAPTAVACVSMGHVAKAQDPFRVLMATLLSLRTKDDTTARAAERLLAVASTPEEVLTLTRRQIEKLIFPVGFFRTKAMRLREISRALIQEHSGRVPRDMETLLRLKGVGRKTANLVLTLGHGLPGICVDVHVHRITNRWGYVRTRSPDDTEARLREVLPPRHWMEINDLLVTFGKTICRPLSPWCSRCPVKRQCARAGVTRTR